MSPIEVLFCRENLAKFGREAHERLVAANRPELRVQVAKCIIACGECSSSLIARVSGQLVTAASADDLIASIDRRAAELQQAQE